MKKIVISLVMVLLFTPTAMAKTGGPIECVGKGKFALSLDTEYVQEQRMKDDKLYIDYGPGLLFYQGQPHIYIYDINFKIERHYSKVQYGILDNLDIFFLSGTQRQKYCYSSDDRQFPSTANAILIDDYNPLLASGLKMKLYSMGDVIDVGFSAAYLWSRGKTKRYTLWTLGGGETIADITHSDIEYHSWDVSLYLYKQFKFLTPYIGAKYQDSTYEYKVDMWFPALGASQYFEQKYNQDMPWIMFWGCDFHINKRLDANIELSTFGSRSASFGLTWRF